MILAQRKKNQQQAKQMHEEQLEREKMTKKKPKKKKSSIPLVCQSSTIKIATPTSRIPTVSCLASRSNFPMHRYKFMSPKS
jgi:ribosomal protein S25